MTYVKNEGCLCENIGKEIIKEVSAIKLYNEQSNSKEYSKTYTNFIISRTNPDGLDGCENWGIDG